MPTMYISKARTLRPMLCQDVDSYTGAFRELATDIPFVPAATDEIHEITIRGKLEKVTDKDYKKWFVLNGFIGGEMIPDRPHKDEFVIYRDILPIDLDDLTAEDEPDILAKVNHLTQGRGYSLIVYKTFSYRDYNPRYRLLFPLDRPVNKSEYLSLLYGIAETLEIKADFKAKAWSQIAFLPVATEYNQENLLQIYEGRPIPVDVFLAKILTQPAYKKAASQLKPKKRYKSNKGKQAIGFALDKLVQGNATQNDWSNVDRFFANIGMYVNEREAWAQYFSEMNRYDFQNTARNRANGKERGTWAEVFSSVLDGIDEGGNGTLTASGERLGRNNSFYILACFLTKQLVEYETLDFLMKDLNERNRPPMTEAELVTIQNSAVKDMG